MDKIRVLALIIPYTYHNYWQIVLGTRLENNKLEDMKTGELFKRFLKYMDRLEAESMPLKFIIDIEELDLGNFKDKFRAS